MAGQALVQVSNPAPCSVQFAPLLAPWEALNRGLWTKERQRENGTCKSTQAKRAFTRMFQLPGLCKMHAQKQKRPGVKPGRLCLVT